MIPIVYIATLYLLASNNIETSLIFQNNIWLKKHFDKAIKPKIWFVYTSGMKPSHIKLSLATHIVQTSNPKGIWHTLVCTCPHQNLMSYVYNYSKGWLELTIPSLECSTQTLSSYLKKIIQVWRDWVRRPSHCSDESILPLRSRSNLSNIAWKIQETSLH